MSLYQELKDALNSVLGATLSNDVRSLTAAGEFLICSTPGELNAICVATTAASAGINFGFQDASATGTGSTRIFQLKNIPAGVWPITFDRPIQFTKGLVLTYTASGVAALDSNTYYTPRNVGNSALPWTPGLR